MSAKCLLTSLTVVTLLSLLIAACGGGKAPSSPPPAPLSPAVSVEPDMKSRLAELERQGALPLLDRSTDIAGPDADGNGIRDDIDAWIAALPVSEPARNAAKQRARVQQRIMQVDLGDRSALMALADASMAATSCMSDVFDIGADAQERFASRRNGASLTHKIAAITANTPERTERYLAYLGALHGTTTGLPAGDTCEYR